MIMLETFVTKTLHDPLAAAGRIIRREVLSSVMWAPRSLLN